MTTKYTTIGEVCGSCEHAHRTIYAAFQCVSKHRRGCNSMGGYSDRGIVHSDLSPLSEDELAKLEEIEMDEYYK